MPFNWPYEGVLPNFPPPIDFYTEPEKFTVGNTLQFWRSLPLQPSNAGWNITYTFLDGKGNKIQFVSTPDNGNHSILVAASVTANWKPGKYKGQGQAINTTTTPPQTVQCYFGYLEIFANTSSGVQLISEVRSPWTIIRDNVLLVLQGRATNDILDSTIEGTTFRRLPMPQLLMLYNRAEQNVRLEDQENKSERGLGNKRNIFTQFTRPL